MSLVDLQALGSAETEHITLRRERRQGGQENAHSNLCLVQNVSGVLYFLREGRNLHHWQRNSLQPKLVQVGNNSFIGVDLYKFC